MKLYVLVRKDLTKSQQAVQAGHAVAEWLLRSPESSKWENSTLVYLGVKNKKHLQHRMVELEEKEKPFIGFKEPYYDNEVTAIATLGDGKDFQDLELLRL